jgi:hypothetical protein
MEGGDSAWRDRYLHAAVRSGDEHGLDSENSPFLKLAPLEAIQAVKDGLEDETLPVEEKRPEADHSGIRRRETAPTFRIPYKEQGNHLRVSKRET